MYEDFRADPASVDESTREFFERWSPPADVASGEGSPAAALEKALKAARLVEGIRSFGYAAARLDPLVSTTPSDPVLEAEFHGLSEEEALYVYERILSSESGNRWCDTVHESSQVRVAGGL
jgi:2-oxoglutarate dehydrogenase E1 component